MSLPNPPKALLFDCFGTVVDWRSSVIAALKAAAGPQSPLTNSQWAEFAQQWNTADGEFTHSFVRGKTDWVDAEEHYHTSLQSLLEQWNIASLWTPDKVFQISRCWHYLSPWPDSSQGIKHLNKKFTTCPLSNGTTPLLNNMAEHAHLEWSGPIISADKFHAYKPDPSLYYGSAKLLGLETKECAMVAAHLGDLKGASECGMQTIYVERQGEDPLGEEEKEAAKGWVNMWVEKSPPVQGFLEIARRFGIE